MSILQWGAENALTALVTVALAQARPRDQQQVQRLAARIRKKIVTLNNYGAFDQISFDISSDPRGRRGHGR